MSNPLRDSNDQNWFHFSMKPSGADKSPAWVSRIDVNENQGANGADGAADCVSLCMFKGEGKSSEVSWLSRDEAIELANALLTGTFRNMDRRREHE